MHWKRNIIIETESEITIATTSVVVYGSQNLNTSNSLLAITWTTEWHPTAQKVIIYYKYLCYFRKISSLCSSSGAIRTIARLWLSQMVENWFRCMIVFQNVWWSSKFFIFFAKQFNSSEVVQESSICEAKQFGIMSLNM